MAESYVYGWGRTKHLPGPAPAHWASWHPAGLWGLCGASGGNEYAQRSKGDRMPVCKHCLRLAAKSARIDGQEASDGGH